MTTLSAEKVAESALNDFDGMTKTELIAYAREHSIPEFDSSMKKAEILDKIKKL